MARSKKGVGRPLVDVEVENYHDVAVRDVLQDLAIGRVDLAQSLHYIDELGSHHSSSETCSWCINQLDRKLTRRLRILMDLGSSPTCGSSTTITSGRCTNALDTMSFWRMPWL